VGIEKTIRRGFKQLMRELQEDVTITHVTDDSTRDSDDVITKTTTTVSTQGTVVTDNDDYSEMGFGRLQTGEVVILLYDDETVADSDTITVGSLDYNIHRIEELRPRGIIIGYAAYGKRNE